ncbi:chemotaxis protein methyltransferase CheR [Rhodospirillum centenum SW]|uniref:Chemotaxis protein methyltransferase n=3 Tax=Rhodospirillum centenum TaxID=34018 RepID=B6IQQ0_RHOCS|nr:CheR2 [Rhodospirillum centenum]ACI97786.1 chemotaxis protein methyltransferase CheR [Rhodospirillum centenum SW]
MPAPGPPGKAPKAMLKTATRPGSRSAVTTVSDDEFRKFCDLIYRRTGMSYGETKRYFVDHRLLERVAQTESPSVQSYLSLLRFDTTGRELELIVNALTVNETYFWREEHQFACLTRSILPDILARKRRGDRLRIWSLPCSTGEEPYSIALWLLENWPEVDHWDVEILASDIDTRVLEAARAGIFDARSVQRLSHSVLGRYFTRLPDDRWQILDALRGSIEFSRVNVSDRDQMAGFRDVDVIFCRNMLIYFDDVSRREAAEAMFSCLTPGGYVCLGHSESMSRISSLFDVRRFDDAIVYQRPFR